MQAVATSGATTNRAAAILAGRAGAVPPPVPSAAGDRLELSSPASMRQPESMAEAAAEGAVEGARIGGLVGNVAIGGMMIRKGLQGGAKVPGGSLFARALPYLGLLFSVSGAIGAGRSLAATLQADRPGATVLAKHGLDLGGNLLIAGGSVAVLASGFAAPALIATGVGFLLTAAAGFLVSE